jgi:hypothetical protein
MSRQYEEVLMPLAEGTTLLHPERVLLRWEGMRRRSDIGQICYLRRDTSSSQRTRRTFDHSSFCSERARGHTPAGDAAFRAYDPWRDAPEDCPRCFARRA